MKENNPYTLTFGREPSEMIQRFDDTEAIISCFDAPRSVSQTYLIEGVRGSGKTVLMTYVASQLSEKKDWISIDLNASADLLEDMALRLSDECKKIKDIFKAGFSVSVAGFGVGINGSDKGRDSVSVVDEILSTLAKKKKKLLITVDEVMCNDSMRRFASQFQIFVRKRYPIYLIMTGLHENIYEIQNDPALTFLLRSPKIRIQPLAIHRIAKRYKSVFPGEEETTDMMAKMTKGYAFAFQALGVLYYEHKDDYTIERIISEFEDMLDDFVYKKIWEAMSPRDKDVILAFTEECMKVSDLCEATGMTSSSFSKYRERLMLKGVIISPKHGYVELALPRFKEVVEKYEKY